MKLRETSPAKHLALLRLIAAVPLIGIGVQHLIGTAPMRPILDGAGIPLAAFFAILVPILEVIAGLGLALGFYARLHAFLSFAIMVVAVYAHVVHDWTDEPAIILPVAVAVCAAQVVWGGAGAFSTDLAYSPDSASQRS